MYNIFLDNKRSNVSIKFLNFCKRNCNAPLSVKLDVLDKCVTSSLLYALETWGKNTHDVELIYRLGIKISLDILHNINNGIVYVEANRYPLECKIKKLQIIVFDYKTTCPDSALSKIMCDEGNRSH